MKQILKVTCIYNHTQGRDVIEFLVKVGNIAIIIKYREWWSFTNSCTSLRQKGETELDALSRRMSFKLPIVIRYSIGTAILFGITHAVFAKNSVWMKRYCYMTPFFAAFLCHEEIIKYFQIQGYLSRSTYSHQEIEEVQPDPKQRANAD